jgi:hypothetical protein
MHKILQRGGGEGGGRIRYNYRREGLKFHESNYDYSWCCLKIGEIRYDYKGEGLILTKFATIINSVV